MSKNTVTSSNNQSMRIIFVSFSFRQISNSSPINDVNTMMFLSIKKCLLYPQNNYGKTTVRDIGFY